MDLAPLRFRATSRAARWAVSLASVVSLGCALAGPTTATSFMNVIERSPDPNERYKAFKALASSRVYDDGSQKARAVRVLLDRLDPKKEPLASRAMICRALGNIGDPAARDAMLRLVRDGDPIIRSEASHTLGIIGRPEDATVLMQAMKLDNDPNCKVASIEALGLLKAVDPRTPIYLVEEMESDDPAIRLASLESLRKITKKDFGVRPEPWRDFLSGRAPAGTEGIPKRDTRPATMPLNLPGVPAPPSQAAREMP